MHDLNNPAAESYGETHRRQTLFASLHRSSFKTPGIWLTFSKFRDIRNLFCYADIGLVPVHQQKTV